MIGILEEDNKFSEAENYLMIFGSPRLTNPIGSAASLRQEVNAIHTLPL